MLAVYQLYLNQWLQIRWRRFLTTRYLGEWLDSGNHYRMQLLGDAADNPDQRIAEDIKQFIDGGSNSVGILPIGLGLLNAVVTLGSFVVILWGLSQAAPLTLAGWTIPGYLVWAALIYAIAGTLLTHLVGRPLTVLNFNQQRYEADFRFNLVRARENSEQIALLHGEPAERGRLLHRFAVVGRELDPDHEADQAAHIPDGQLQSDFERIPDRDGEPGLFFRRDAARRPDADRVGLQQRAGRAVVLHQRVSPVRRMARRDRAARRLRGSDPHCTRDRRHLAGDQARAPASGEIRLDGLEVVLPDGKPLVAADGIAFAPRDQVLVTGRSGSGKSTLFRAIAGIWPFGKGTVSLPANAKVMTLPQRPYLPIGTLGAAVSYPAVAGTFDERAHPPKSCWPSVSRRSPARLDEEAHWNRMLSIGEQQRIGIARAILHAPDYLLLDEASASLDEPGEAALYRLLQERLPAAAIVSIGHRSTLAAFHKRRLTLTREGERHRVEEAALNPAS